VLPHRRPRVYDTSSIQRNTLPTNLEQARGSKGPQPRDNRQETPQTPPYPPWDPLGSHLDKNRREQSCLGVDRSPSSAKPILRPLTLPFQVSASRDEPKAVPGACPNIRPKACSSLSWKIHQLGPYSSTPRVTTSLVPWWLPRQPRELLLAYKYEGRG
jgi:hypothetical protein